MDNNTESKPALVFIPKGEYNSIFHKILFSDAMERWGFDMYKMKREYSFPVIVKLFNNYNFSDIVFFSFEDIGNSYMTKRILLTLAIKKGINLREMNSGLCLYNNGEIDINTIYFFLRGNFPSNSKTRTGFKKIISKFL